MEKETQMADKIRFFAQYWGQDYIYKNEHGKFKGNLSDENSIYHFKNNLKNNNPLLLLKPLLKITDEDSVGVANIISTTIHDSVSKELVFYYKEDILKDPEVLCFASYKTVDFLRSKGYALPFMEYSVDDLVSLGWVLLI